MSNNKEYTYPLGYGDHPADALAAAASVTAFLAEVAINMDMSNSNHVELGGEADGLSCILRALERTILLASEEICKREKKAA